MLAEHSVIFQVSPIPHHPVFFLGRLGFSHRSGEDARSEVNCMLVVWSDFRTRLRNEPQIRYTIITLLEWNTVDNIVKYVSFWFWFCFSFLVAALVTVCCGTVIVFINIVQQRGRTVGG